MKFIASRFAPDGKLGFSKPTSPTTGGHFPLVLKNWYARLTENVLPSLRPPIPTSVANLAIFKKIPSN
jgi:hypothetical protein